MVPASNEVPSTDSDGNNSEEDNTRNSDVSSVSSSRSLEASFTMDRQPQAPRRSVSPVQRRPKEEIDATLKSANTTNMDSEGENNTVDEDLEYIAKLYGGDNYVADDCSSDSDLASTLLKTTRASPDVCDELPPPPPLRHITEDESSPNGKIKHDYDGRRAPARSAMRKPNSKTRNANSIDNSQHKSREIKRGVGRNNSTDGTEDTRRGSIGSLHSIRNRGFVLPVQQRMTSIGFVETVRVKEVTPTVELNDGNTRDLWLQEDEAMEMKEHRRTLLRRYKEREAKKKREAERKRKEQEQIIRQQKVKNLLNASKPKNSKNSLGHFVSQNAAAKKHPRWAGIGKTGVLKKPEQHLPGVATQAGVRWKAEHPAVMGLSAPSRGMVDPTYHGLYMGNATSSFMSTSSAGSSLSGHDSDSFRGLEKYIDRSGKHQKNMVWDAVLIEQDEQLQFGYYDDEKIASLYRTVQNQHDGQQKALDRARKDRKAAEKYLMTPRTMKTMKMLKENVVFDRSGMSSLLCGDLLEEISTETELKEKGEKNEKDSTSNEETEPKDEVSNSNNKQDPGDHAEIDAVANATNNRSENDKKGGSQREGRSSGKRYKKFLRRLSV